jgi:hypothetical protein
MLVAIRAYFEVNPNNGSLRLTRLPPGRYLGILSLSSLILLMQESPRLQFNPGNRCRLPKITDCLMNERSFAEGHIINVLVFIPATHVATRTFRDQ